MHKNRRAKITPWQLVLWPDKNGHLVIPPSIEGERTNLPIGQPNARRESSSQRSLHSRRVRPGRISRALSFFSSSLWRSLSSRIGYSFSKATDHYFVTWLTAKILEAEFEALTLTEALSLASVELQVEEETIKRLIVKHTRRDAEFRLQDGVLAVRR